MNDKRDEIRKLIDLIQRYGCPHAKCPHTEPEQSDCVNCILKALNPLVVIPVEGVLPKAPDNITFYDGQYAYSLALGDIVQAGYVLGKKLVEATNE